MASYWFVGTGPKKANDSLLLILIVVFPGAPAKPSIVN